MFVAVILFVSTFGALITEKLGEERHISWAPQSESKLAGFRANVAEESLSFIVVRRIDGYMSITLMKHGSRCTSFVRSVLFDFEDID
jgi:hypothetical protein